MNFLVIGTPEDRNFLRRFAALLGGHRVFFQDDPITLSITLAQKAVAGKLDGVIVTCPQTLAKLVSLQLDYSAPSGREKINIEDWAGSLLQFTHPSLTKELPCLIINPLAHLLAVRHGEFLTKRFLTKLTAPEQWKAYPKLQWTLFNPSLAAEVESFMASCDIISIDIETNPNEKRIICSAYCGYRFADKACRVYVVPFDSTYAVAFAGRLNALPVAKLFQGGIYDNAYFLRYSIPATAYYYDSLVLFHSWYSELPKRLDFLAPFFLREVRYWKHDGRSADMQTFYRYNAQDAWITLFVWLRAVEEAPDWALQNYKKSFKLIFPSLHCGMEGFLVDKQKFLEVKAAYTATVSAKTEAIGRLVGYPGFNVGSPKQVALLLKVLGSDVTTTSEKDLKKAQALSALHNRIFGAIIELRKERKLLSTYFQETKLNGERILYTLDPCGTDTGRLASRESPFDDGLQIQNIPRGDIVKQCFIADAGYVFGTGDYPQSEARCVAYESSDPALIKLVESIYDYHSWNAQEFFGVPYAEVWDQEKGYAKNKLLRDLSKRTNHGANYNMGAAMMLDTMGPTYVQQAKTLLKLPAHWSLLKVCEHLLDAYAKTYSRVKGIWYQRITSQVESTKMLVSQLGWTRYCFGHPAANKRDLNSYVAHVPQNLSVGIINEAFFNIWYKLQICKYPGKLRLKAQIHDEILFQYKLEIEEELIPQIREAMTIPVQVKGADDKVREMVIHPSMNWGEKVWSELK